MITVKIYRRPDGDYTYRCGRVVNGLYWTALGCQHLVPREAAKHADSLEPVTPAALDLLSKGGPAQQGSSDPAVPPASPLAPQGASVGPTEP